MQTISLQVRLLVLGVTALATLLLTVLADRIPWQAWPQLLLVFVMIVIASSVRVFDPRGRSVTPSTVLTYLAIYIFNPISCLLIVGVGRTIGYAFSRGWVPWRAIFNGAQGGLSVALGAFAVQMLGGLPRRFDDYYMYLTVLVGPIVQQAANTFFVAFGTSRWRGTPFFHTWLGFIRDLFLPNLLSIPTAFVLAILYLRVHHAVTLTYLALLPLQWKALSLYVKRRQLYAQIVDGLVVAADVNFPLGRGHARRVAELAVAIAREMRLSEESIESIQFAALLHDVGMIGKDDALERPLMSPEDAESLRDHVRVGADIAKELPRSEIADMILRHHERYDGGGYPGALTGESIPLGARVIGLAEVVESMASGTFPHTSAFRVSSILAYVRAERERAFDPEVADAFMRAVEQGSVSLGGMKAIGDRGVGPSVRLGELPAR